MSYYEASGVFIASVLWVVLEERAKRNTSCNQRLMGLQPKEAFELLRMERKKKSLLPVLQTGDY
jgi:hypothetical protein